MEITYRAVTSVQLESTGSSRYSMEQTADNERCDAVGIFSLAFYVTQGLSLSSLLKETFQTITHYLAAVVLSVKGAEICKLLWLFWESAATAVIHPHISNCDCLSHEPFWLSAAPPKVLQELVSGRRLPPADNVFCVSCFLNPTSRKRPRLLQSHCLHNLLIVSHLHRSHAFSRLPRARSHLCVWQKMPSAARWTRCA